VTQDAEDPFAPATVVAEAIRGRRLSSREAVTAMLARIEDRNPACNAVVAVDVERALADAARADEEMAGDAVRGPLHGVPMTVKDTFETAGLVTTAGAPALARHVPTTDALVVSRLRAAGAVIVGKTNTPLYAGDIQTYNEVYGLTRNPWDPARTVGGSSGGSAAALAAGITPLELGSDIGGSIRTPAHCCGVYGLKPSWGIVPSRGHIPPAPGSLVETDVSTPGPLARSVADLTVALDVLAGPLPEESAAWRLELPAPDPDRDLRPGVRGLRLGVVTDDPAVPVAEEVRAVLRSFADRLADAGAEIVDRPVPVSMEEGAHLWQELVLPIFGRALPEPVFRHLTGVEPDGWAPEPAGDDLDARQRRGLTLRYRDWTVADERRAHGRRAWAEAFTGLDAFLAPVLPTPAFPHDTERGFIERTLDYDGVAHPYAVGTLWAGAIGVMRLPVVVMPAGQTASGLPVGVQIIGPYLQDRALLARAARMDAVTGGFVAPPGY
jgi:amidase